MAVPVMKDDSSLARNNAALASSPGMPQRPTGCGGIRSGGGVAPRPFSASPVQVMPGQMALTRTPCFAKSSAADLVSCTTPPLAAAYAARPFQPTRADAEAVLMTDPPPPVVSM